MTDPEAPPTPLVDPEVVDPSITSPDEYAAKHLPDRSMVHVTDDERAAEARRDRLNEAGYANVLAARRSMAAKIDDRGRQIVEGVATSKPIPPQTFGPGDGGTRNRADRRRAAKRARAKSRVWCARHKRYEWITG